MDNTSTVVHERKRYDLIDLFKLILSFLVVAITTNLFEPYLYPWVRIAVPMFYMFSSFFFFKKVNARRRRSSKRSELKHFILRIVKLYLVWFLVFSPIILYQRKSYFLGQGIIGVFNLITNFFVGSTFTGSWFLSALAIGMVIIFFTSRKLNNTVLLAIFGTVYVLITLRSAYFPFFSNIHFGMEIAGYYESVLNSPISTFPSSLFWLVMGKVFADGFRMKLKPSIIMTSISAVVLFLEWFFISRVTVPSVYDASYYISLAPLCIGIFAILLNFENVKIKLASKLRRVSTIIFVTHGTILFCFNAFLRLISVSLPSVVIFLIVSIVSAGLGALIVWLQTHKKFAWLYYAF